MKYLIGIDLGTSATKTVLFDDQCQVVASASEEYPLYQPKNGWAEQDPLDWWNAAARTSKQVIEESGIDPKAIAGIGISGQMHGLVMLDKDGNVLRRSIIWCDQRTDKECEEITELIGRQRVIEITANPVLPGFTAPKILWVRKNEPEIYAKCAHILLPKDYVRYMLTGEFATEVSDASGMSLLDVPNRCWSDEVLEKLEIDKSLLAKVYESPDITGKVTAKAAALTGLAEGTPVVGGAGDNAAAAVGTGVVEEGKAFTTLGTSGVVFAHSDSVTIDPEGRVHTFCSAVPGCWTVMSCALASGLSLKWFRDNFFTSEMETAVGMGVDPYYLMDKEAEKIEIGADRLIYLPHLMGERYDPYARGVFFGLSAIHTKYNMLRAVLEGVIYSQREFLDILRGMGVVSTSMLACGGGGTSKIWRQMMADVYDLPVQTVQNKEGPALGVAILAGVGTGVFESVPEACRKFIGLNAPQDPIAENVERYKEFYEIYYDINHTLTPQFRKLQSL